MGSKGPIGTHARPKGLETPMGSVVTLGTQVDLMGQKQRSKSFLCFLQRKGLFMLYGMGESLSWVNGFFVMCRSDEEAFDILDHRIDPWEPQGP